MTYFNSSNEIIVKINGDRFVIIGNEDLVSDSEITEMYNGNAPEGWERS